MLYTYGNFLYIYIRLDFDDLLGYYYSFDWHVLYT